MNIIQNPYRAEEAGGRKGIVWGIKLPGGLGRAHVRKQGVMHPLKVLLYAIFRNIPVHPMPQNHRPAFVRRVQEPGFKFRSPFPDAARKQRQNSRDTEDDPFHALNIRILRLSLSLLLVWLKNDFFFYLTG